jgi:hypothetical protein
LYGFFELLGEARLSVDDVVSEGEFEVGVAQDQGDERGGPKRGLPFS